MLILTGGKALYSTVKRVREKQEMLGKKKRVTMTSV